MKLVTEYFQYEVVLSELDPITIRWDYRFEESRLGGSWLYKLGLRLTNHTEVMRRFVAAVAKRRRFDSA